MAESVTKATLLLRTVGRALEDADDAVQDAIADRDAADDDLDTMAQEARANLAGRGATAVKEEPYTLVYHAGIGYYTAATLDEQHPRYMELKQRVTEHLPASDE